MPRLLAVIATVALTLAFARTSWGWIEKRVESSSTSLELERDGSATVRHELWLDVRGAPLKQFELDGIDPDAEMLADATVTRMKGGVATSLPLPVQVFANAGRAEVTVPLRQGFRGRTFRLQFGYRTRLAQRGLLRPSKTPGISELAWVGPRFADGVDSVTLTVRTAAGARAPEPATASAPETANYGIVMSTLRRSQQRDELELVRAHVARDEAMVWRVGLDSGLFATGAATQAAPSAPSQAPLSAAVVEAASPAPRASVHFLHVVLGGVAYALLVWLKAWRVARAAALRGCRPRTTSRWRTPARAALAGTCAACAAAVVFWSDAPALAAAFLIAALAFATEAPAEIAVVAHGGGEWRPVDASALQAEPTRALPGAWLDAGRPQGFVLLLSLLAASTWGASTLFGASPYLGACALLASTLWLPVFCTGRSARLPADMLAQSRKFLTRAQRRLSRAQGLVVLPIGRFSTADGRVEELRLSIAPERGLPGLVGMELALSFRARFGGHCAEPVIIVRASDGSPCQRALPRGLSWTRGRKNDERATLIRPKLATLTFAVALVHELLGAMRPPVLDPATPPRKKTAKSSGKGLSTKNSATRSSPAHAT